MRDRSGGTVAAMEEARAVLERLARIEALDRADAGASELIVELRALLEEAEAWSRVEGRDGGEGAVDRLRSALAGVAPGTPSAPPGGCSASP